MIAIPTCSCDPLCNLAQRSILLALILEGRRKHPDFDRLLAIHTLQNGPNRRQARIAPATWRRLKSDRSVRMPKPSRRTQSQRSIFGQFQGTLPCPLTQIAFGIRLQAPGNPAKQMRVVRRARFLSKQLLEPGAQRLRLQLAQTLDLGRQGLVHACFLPPCESVPLTPPWTLSLRAKCKPATPFFRGHQRCPCTAHMKCLSDV